jgi:hypothetical protein
MPDETYSANNSAWIEQSFSNEISSLFNAHGLEENPPIPLEKRNNPYSPPEGNRSPINDLPNEILAYIFGLGVHLQSQKWQERNGGGNDNERDWVDLGDDDDDTNGYRRPILVFGRPLVLDLQILVSHVCRRWRLLALDTPNLWSILLFSNRSKMTRAKEYIARSKTLPLKISLFDTGHPSDEDRFSQILDLIEPEGARWGAFAYRYEREDINIRSLMSRLHGMPEARLLESFKILCSTDRFYDEGPMESFLPFHGHAPNLKEAVFSWGTPIDWDRALQHLLRGLRRLNLCVWDVHRPSYTAFVRMIDHSPELHRLTLSFASFDRAFDHDSPTNVGSEFLTIPSLRELSLHICDSHYALAFVERLVLPNLQTIHLSFRGGSHSNFIWALSNSFNGQNRSSLQRISYVSISGLTCNVPSLRALLAQLVALKTLRIDSLGFMEDWAVFTSLASPREYRMSPLDSMCCPKLEEFIVPAWNGKRLKNFIDARRDAGVPIKKLVVKEGVVSKEDLRWIRKNVGRLALC